MKYSELPKEIKLQDDVNTLLDVNEELRQRVDKANELLTEYFCSWDYTACEFKDVVKILSTLSIILNSENWKNRAEVKEMIEGEDNERY